MFPFVLVALGICYPASCRPSLAWRPEVAASPLITLVSSFNVSPGLLSITSTSPATGPVASTATASWTVLVNLLGDSWTLSVQAAASTFSSCPNVPLSAMTVTCSSIVDGGISGATHSCASPFTLSTSGQMIASGRDPVLTIAGSRTVSIQFSFTDSWTYPGTTTPCTVSLNYTLNAA
jgi:hypothetical protein